MLRTLSTLLIISVSIFALQKWYFYAPPPCEKPIAYRIGSFDKRFDLSESNFLSAIKKAESLWESAAGKDLFVYAPNDGKLDVNLVYDHRQEVTEELHELEDEVEETEAQYRSLESQYEVAKARHGELESAYESRVEAFDERSQEYDRMVEDWNNSSRTSRPQFEALERERREVEAEFASLKALEAEVNESARAVNTLVARINRLGRTLNINVEEYNTLGAMRGDTFTGGLYTREGREEKIEIFEFSSEAKLVRILAHELGHALGLEHIDDRTAIMYELNQGETVKLSPSDIRELKKLCGI